MKTLNQSPWQVEGGETLPLLYEIDQQLWLEETIKLLKENRLDELDVIHLIDYYSFLILLSPDDRLLTPPTNFFSKP